MEEKRKYKVRKPGDGREKWKPEHDTGKNLKEQMDAATAALKLSKASVTSYLPYQKSVYFSDEASPEKISAGAEQQRRYNAMKRWKADPTEKKFLGGGSGLCGSEFQNLLRFAIFLYCAQRQKR